MGIALNPLDELRNTVPAVLEAELAQRQTLALARQRFLLTIPSERTRILQELGQAVAQAHRTELHRRLDVARVRSRLLFSPRTRIARQLAWAAGGFVAAAVGAIALVLAFRPAPALTFTVNDEAGHVAKRLIASPTGEPTSMQFSDGSTLVLESGSETRVIGLDRRGARVQLAQGALRVQIVPRPDNHWTVDAGPFEVRVVGTRFRVAWDAEQQHFTLEMSKGRVRVRGPGLGEREFEHDQAVDVWVSDKRVLTHEAKQASATPPLPTPPAGPSPTVTALQAVNTSPSQVAPPPVATSDSSAHAPSAQTKRTRHAAAQVAMLDQPVVPSVPPAGDSPRVPPEPTALVPPAPEPSREAAPSVSKAGPRGLAAAGEYDKALQAAEQQGWSAILSSARADELAALATAARGRGNPALAGTLLETIRRRFQGTKAAADAAFALGSLRVHDFADDRSAAQWFSRYLSERPQGPLAREASGRLIECLERSGQGSEACSAARRYQRAYPDGPHFAYAARVLQSCVDTPKASE